MLVHLQRAEADLHATRALIQSTLPEGKAGDAAIKAFQAYCAHQIPFLERAQNMEQEEARAKLDAFIKNPVRFPLAPIMAARAASTARKIKANALRATRAKGTRQHAQHPTGSLFRGLDGSG